MVLRSTIMDPHRATDAPPAHGLELTVIMPHRPPGRYLWDFLPESRSVVRFVHFEGRDLKRRKQPLGELRSLITLARRGLRQSEGADAILSVGALAGLVVEVMRRLTLRHKTPHVIAECIIYPQWGVRGLLKRMLYRLLLPMVSGIVCGATSEVQAYARHYGVPEEKLHLALLFAAQDVFDWPAQTVRPGSVFSGGDGMRDYATLLAAMRKVELPATIYTSLRVRHTPPGHVVLHPPVSRKQFLDAMMSAEIVVVPLTDVPVSAGQLVVLQAMAMGKPVVTTNSAAIGDYVTDGETALVVDCGDAEAMARAIRRLHEDPALRRAIGTRAREAADQHFRGAVYARRVEDILAHVSNRRD